MRPNTIIEATEYHPEEHFSGARRTFAVLGATVALAVPGMLAAGCGSSESSGSRSNSAAPDAAHTHTSPGQPSVNVDQPPAQSAADVKSELDHIQQISPNAVVTRSDVAWALNLPGKYTVVQAETSLGGSPVTDTVQYFDPAHSAPSFQNYEPGSSSADIYLDTNPKPGDNRPDYVDSTGKFSLTMPGAPASPHGNANTGSTLLGRYESGGWSGWISDQSPATHFTPQQTASVNANIQYNYSLVWSAVKGNQEMFLDLAWTNKPGSEAPPITKLSRAEQLNRLKALGAIFVRRKAERPVLPPQ